jgi:hypothetical protein
MAVPYSETIIEAIKAKLELVTVANGYSFDATGVYRHDRNWSRRPDQILMMWVGEHKRAQGRGVDTPGRDVTLLVTILCPISQTEADSDPETDPTDAKVNLRAGDLEEAILSVNWAALSARLDDINSQPFAVADDEDPFDGAQIDLEISYSVDGADTTQVIPLEEKE